MDMAFSGEVVYWRGPSPFHFVFVPEDESLDIEAMSRQVTYGWGMIPVTVQIGRTRWKTSLFAKDGGYVVPVKADVRRAEGIELGDVVEMRMSVGA